MRLSTLRPDTGHCAAAREQDGEFFLLPHTDVGDRLATGEDWPERAARYGGHRVRVSEASLAPLVPHPSKSICLGLNYARHIAEMGRPAPAYPTLFAKCDGALIGSRDDTHMPAVSDDLGWGAELGVVIARRPRSVTVERALGHVAGYTVINDVTVRDWQHRTREFLSGKTFEATTPVGPALVTTGELPAVSGLETGCSADGHVMQRSNTADLLFDVARTVAYISTIILFPGDLIATGTPGGVGARRDPAVFLTPGQELVTRLKASVNCATSRQGRTAPMLALSRTETDGEKGAPWPS